ncbi:hypothetical protein AMTRI_Chr09g20030 [Amborella trichopoda]|uniref:auxin-responsive protein SAUR50 n=1 Tax=Amborella trichopoda TaxID=13333 RepID=UPI0005D35DAB|nr:auxin-responsive protein SAUR50 [Amborella trichopoda]|eukprot:XP_006832992.2 auxin-responsive protein SAUR50 [Amborella trichopoda]
MTSFSRCNKIRHIVHLRQMLRRWRRKAAEAARVSAFPSGFSGVFSGGIPADVPAGHLAVQVGSKRFVVRATHLNHPAFQRLLREAEEEYGYEQQGPLSLPCDERVFEEILLIIGGKGKGCGNGLWKESSMPLLHGLVEKSVG